MLTSSHIHVTANPSGGIAMNGRLATKQKCPACGGRFIQGVVLRGKLIIGVEGLVCSKCHKEPTKIYIRLKWRGKAYELRMDKSGNSFSTVPHAYRTLEILRADIDEKRFTPKAYQQIRRHSYENFFKVWVKKYEESPATHRKLQSIHVNHLLPFFKDYDMRDIDGLAIQSFINQLTSVNQKTSDRQAMAASYKALIYSWLRILLNAAYTFRVIENPPVLPVKPKFEKKEILWLTDAQQQLVLDEIPFKHKDIFIFLFEAGIRVSEACALKRDCINQEVYIIKRTFSDNVLRETTKGKKAFVKYTTPLIWSLFKRQPLTFNGFVFTNQNARSLTKHYTLAVLERIWNNASRKAGVEKMPLKNGTRHSWGSKRIVAGFSPEQVSHGMGHGTVDMTNNYMVADISRQKALYNDENLEGVQQGGVQKVCNTKNGTHK